MLQRSLIDAEAEQSEVVYHRVLGAEASEASGEFFNSLAVVLAACKQPECARGIGRVYVERDIEL